MFRRWVTLVLWALVAASAVAWGLRLFTQARAVPPQAVVASAGPAAVGDLSRLLGADPPPPAAAPAAEAAPPPPESSRFQLIGVAAAAPAAARAGGIALIALDGKPARAYRVGAVIDGAYVLQDVRARSVAIGPRGQAPTLSLELPALPPPATGVPGGAAPLPSTAAPGLPVMPAPGSMPQDGLPPGAQPPGSAAPLAVQPPPALPNSPSAARVRTLRQGGGATAVQPAMAPTQPLQPLQAATDEPAQIPPSHDGSSRR